MPPHPGITGLPVSSHLTKLLIEERDITRDSQIANSPLKTQIKRANTAAFDFVEPKGPLNLGAGIAQNRKERPVNAFKESGSSNAQPSGDVYGVQKPARTASNVYDDNTDEPQTVGTGNAYENDGTDSVQNQQSFGNVYSDNDAGDVPPDNRFGDAWSDDVSLEQSDGNDKKALEDAEKPKYGQGAYNDDGMGDDPMTVLSGKAYDATGQEVPIAKIDDAENAWEDADEEEPKSQESDSLQSSGNGGVPKPVHQGFGANAAAGAWGDDDLTVDRYFAAPQKAGGDAAPPQAEKDFKFQQLANFAENTRTRFADRRDRRELISEDDVRKESHHASVMGRYQSKQDAEAHGIDAKSPIARLNSRTRMTIQERREFFREQAREKGFVGDDGNELGYDSLTITEKLKLGYGKLVEQFGGDSKWERGAFAVDMALDKAIGVSMDEYAAGREQPEIGKMDSDHDQRKEIARGVDKSEKFRDETYKLTPAGIEAGKKALIDYLERDPDNNFPNEADREALAEDFGRWAAEYNTKVDERNALREERRTAMSGSVLKELGVPMLTVEEALADKTRESDLDHIYAAIEDTYLQERGFSAWKNALAFVATVFTGSIAYHSSAWVRRHWANTFAGNEMNAEINRRFGAAMQNYVRQENRMTAENWVLDQYRYDPAKAKNIGAETLFDPHGLYAVFGNFSKEKILGSIEDQLTLAAGFSLEEPPAKGAGNYEDYQRFISYRGAMATGIYEGLRDGLHQRAGEQLRLRVVDKMTADANSYVVSANATMRQNCHLAWNWIGETLDNYQDPGTRSWGSHRIVEYAKEVQDIHDELARSDENGTFALEDGSDDAEPRTFTLPMGGARRTMLEENVAAAQKDIQLALKSFQEVDDILGRFGQEGSMREIQDQLDRDLISMRWGVEDDQRLEAPIDLDKIEAQLAALRARAGALEGQIPTEDRGRLTRMISELEQRVASQKHIHKCLADVRNELLRAKAAGDLEGKDVRVNQLADGIDYEREVLADIAHPLGISEEFANAHLRRLSERIRSQISGTRKLLQAKEAAEAGIRQIKDELRDGKITLREAVTRANQASAAVVADSKNFARDNAADADLVAKFDSVKDDLDTQIAQLLPVALGAEVAENQELSEEATGIAKSLLAAGQDSEAVLGALKQRLGTGGDQVVSLQQVDDLLKKVKISPQQITSVADNLFDGNPEVALSFKLAMLRQQGASEQDLARLKHAHYRQEATGIVLDSQAAVNKAHGILIGDKKQPVPPKSSARHLKPPTPQKNDESDYDIYSTDSEDGDGHSGRRVEDDVIDQVVELSKTHPLFRGVSEKWVTEAALDLKELISHPDEKRPMSGEQISRALTFAAMFQGLTADVGDDALANMRRQFQQAEAGNIGRQILADFGLGDTDLQDADKMSKATNEALVNKQNALGMQELGRRSATVRGLMAAQQQEAELIKGAVIQPLKEFSELIETEKAQTSDDVIGLMKSDKFQAKAKVLQDLCLLADAQEAAQQKRAKGLEDSDICRANVMAMKELAPNVRNFNPKTLEAGNRTVNRLAMWWKKERADDVADKVLDDTGKKMAGRFANVWRHLSMLNAIAESNEDLTRDLENLQKQHDSLLTRVQRHRQDQLVALAILEEFKGSKGTMENLDLKDTETVKSIQARLSGWGQPDAWAGFAGRNGYIVENGLNPTVLQKWRSDASGLPSELQTEYDQLNQALSDFELLIGDAGKAQAAIAGTPLDPSRAAQYAADKVDAELQGLAPEKAGHQFRGMLNSAADWHRHADWQGGPAADMRQMTPQRFVREMKVGLLKFSEGIKDTRSAKRISTDEQQSDRQWINAKLVTLLDKTEEFNSKLESALVNQTYRLKVSEKTREELKQLGEEIKAGAQALQPDKSDGKLHRFSHRGPIKHRYHVPNNHFLNKVDAALHRNLPIMVDEQLARLDQ